MANIDAPFGLRAVGMLGSAPSNEGTSQYKISNGYTTAIYAGDVVFAGNGAQTDNSGTTSVAGYLATSKSNSVLNVGVFNGAFYQDPTTNKPTFQNYWPGDITVTTGDIDGFVYDSPDVLFECQTTGQLTQANVFESVDIVYTAGTAVTNGRSKVQLAGTAVGDTGGMFRIIRLSEDPANSDTSVDGANWIVRFNEHQYYNTGS
tara:strand:+ start:32 stop:643 length:612 start_codon:yes stop_codon:yes gene_type:complete